MQQKVQINALYTLLMGLLFVACTNQPENVMSRTQFTNFLVDLHTLDGALAVKGMGYADNREAVYYYNNLFIKHGITQADFDSTLAWYVKHPKKFERVYSQVIDELNVLNQNVQSNMYHPIDSAKLRSSQISIWPLAQSNFKFTTDSTTHPIRFTVKNRQLAWKDVYVLSFLHRVAPGSSRTNQQAIIRVHYSDKKTDSIVCKTHSDSILRRYTMTLRVRNKSLVDSVTGAILNYDLPTKGFVAQIDSIQLIRKYDALAQDSIHKAVQLKIDSSGELPIKLRLRSKVLQKRIYYEP